MGRRKAPLTGEEGKQERDKKSSPAQHQPKRLFFKVDFFDEKRGQKETFFSQGGRYLSVFVGKWSVLVDIEITAFS